jgi:hypothetical protein
VFSVDGKFLNTYGSCDIDNSKYGNPSAENIGKCVQVFG